MKTPSPRENVTLVIPGRDAARTVCRCLEAVVPLLASGELAEIIFVDDQSEDETASLVQQFPITYARGTGGGPGAARNIGWRMARTSLVWFVDADCVAEQDALGQLLPHLRQRSVAAAGGTYGNMCPDSLLACLIHEEIVDRHRRMPTDVDFVATFNVLYRRAVLEQLNGFDERFRLAQDAELAYRVKEAGYHIHFEPASQVFHYHPTTLARYLRTQFRQGYYRVLLYRRHPGRIAGDSYSSLLDHLQPPLAVLVLLSLPVVLILNALDLNELGSGTSGTLITFVPLGLIVGLLSSIAPATVRLVFRTHDLTRIGFAHVCFVRAFARGLGMAAGFCGTFFSAAGSTAIRRGGHRKGAVATVPGSSHRKPSSHISVPTQRSRRLPGRNPDRRVRFPDLRHVVPEKRRANSEIIQFYSSYDNIGNYLPVLGIRRMLGCETDFWCMHDCSVDFEFINRHYRCGIIGGAGLLHGCFEPFWRKLAAECQIPLIIWGVGICLPDRTAACNETPPVDRAIVRKVAARCDLINVRDDLTAEWYGLPPGRTSISMCPTLAYLRDRRSRFRWRRQWLLSDHTELVRPDEVTDLQARLQRARLRCDYTNNLQTRRCGLEDILKRYYLRSTGVISTRLHGAIIAYSLGLPYVLWARDAKLRAFARLYGNGSCAERAEDVTELCRVARDIRLAPPAVEPVLTFGRTALHWVSSVIGTTAAPARISPEIETDATHAATTSAASLAPF